MYQLIIKIPFMYQLIIKIPFMYQLIILFVPKREKQIPCPTLVERNLNSKLVNTLSYIL
jgi:hypothetical protein